VSWETKYINKILQGNSADILKDIPENSIHLVITSPPYFKQREYGGFQDEIGNETTVEEYVDNLLEVFDQCVRILKPEGSIVFNIGDTYKCSNLLLVPYRFALEAQKRETVKLNNVITWVKKNPTPRQFKRRLVSSTEPFFHFVKTSNYYFDIDKWIEENNRKLGKTKSNTLIGQSYFELIEESDLSSEQKDIARKELNETIKEVKQGKIAGLRMKIRGIHAPAFGGQEGGRQIQLRNKGFTIIKIRGKTIKRDVIETAVESIRGRIHPAIYPEVIITQFLKLLTQPNNIVLDPFVGSGTTCVTAKKMNRRYIGIDINQKYCSDVEKRLRKRYININNLINQSKLGDRFASAES